MRLLFVLAFATTLSAQTEKMLGEISADHLGAHVKTLVGFGTRGNYSKNIGEVRKWLTEQFKSYSPRFDLSASDNLNIVAVLPGAVEPAKEIIVGAHYDSINARNKQLEAPAPGADDDASGVAVVLELARVMSQYHFRKTVVFIAFGGEEIGLNGSSRYAARAKVNKEQIEAVLNNDVVGSNVMGVLHSDFDGHDEPAPDGLGDTGNLLRVYSPEPVDSPSRLLAKTLQQAVAKYVPNLRLELVSAVDRFGRTGDHASFQQRGFAAIRLTSGSENTGAQHTPNDTLELISPPFMALVAQANAATIAALATAVH